MLLEDIGMNSKECAEFLLWLYHRLKLKYKEEDIVLKKIGYIIQQKKIVDDKISVNFINGLCNKYYPGFELEQTPDLKMGYSNEEKREIRSLIASIVTDTINAQ